ncbi:conserved hypothetical protein [delta proteobacterium NaphS2]|nr:conserved hypothetical protein [delta proteobacterium NaphS2]
MFLPQYFSAITSQTTCGSQNEYLHHHPRSIFSSGNSSF